MKVSLSWLRDYVTVDRDVADVAEALTMAGLEVEALVDRYAYLDGVVVGRIVEITPHPDADKLSLCKVDIGTETKAIVCAAANISEDDLVPVALPGVELAGIGKIESGRIRGEVSEGMLCSEAELAIGTQTSGILLLPEGQRPGGTITKALKLSDTVIEFDLTPNRSDCLSIIGIAREVAAILETPLKHPDIRLPEGQTPIDKLASVTLEAPDYCPRYTARLVSGIKVAPSPFWLQDRLNSVGLRAINNVVDVTNFVLMEMGQPLHAFDFNRLAQGRIVVKTAREGQTFTTLDGMERKLSSEVLMICDGKEPVALAGIMGGLDSEIEDDTTQVLIESAYFNPTTTRRTAKQLGLSTESSYRFERGVDHGGVVRALDRATQLICRLAGGKLASGIIDEYPKPIPEKVIELSTNRTNRLLGTSFDRDKIASYLESVELDVKILDEDILKVVPPTFRVDLERPQDLMEEVARLSGYNGIVTTHPVTEVLAKEQKEELQVRKQLKEVLSGCGFFENITYSFIGKDACDKLLLAGNDYRRQMISILNPLTEAQDVMRTSLLPCLLGTMLQNVTQQNKDLKIFELGKIFLKNTQEEELPTEVEMISALWTGLRQDRAWHSKEVKTDFYDIKGVVETLFRAANIQKVRFSVPSTPKYPYLKPGRVAEVYARGELIGTVGEIIQQVLQNFDLKQAAYVFELNFDQLVRLRTCEKSAKPISRFPATSRDIALIVDNALEAQEVLHFVEAQDQELVKSVEIFDIYKGLPIPDGKKSLALRFRYCSFERSLTDEEVNKVHEVVTQKVLKHFKAQLPEK
ncbi:MAG: phenylalanine--tRNA ligase subunit beta [Desulfobacterales bacterium S7086C20]|nr:MAG: phenylalanine--tRNA ligase subunit beta [Desulfobacterales bacterium S7086C20]